MTATQLTTLIVAITALLGHLPAAIALFRHTTGPAHVIRRRPAEHAAYDPREGPR